MKLTEHFTLEEFEYSATAIANGIDNRCPSTHIPNLQNLCKEVLEPLRQHVGIPVIISSGYRCPELNRMVGGVANSQHMMGEAADIVVDECASLKECFLFIQNNCRFDQLIIETKGNLRWIHVSLCRDDSRNRQHALSIHK